MTRTTAWPGDTLQEELLGRNCENLGFVFRCSDPCVSCCPVFSLLIVSSCLKCSPEVFVFKSHYCSYMSIVCVFLCPWIVLLWAVMLCRPLPWPCELCCCRVSFCFKFVQWTDIYFILEFPVSSACGFNTSAQIMMATWSPSSFKSSHSTKSNHFTIVVSELHRIIWTGTIQDVRVKSKN